MVLHLDTDDGLKVIMSTRTHGMLSARNFGLILALCVIIRVLPDLTFEYKDTICPYSQVERRFKASDAFFLEKHVATLLSYVVLERTDISLVEFSTVWTARVPYKYNGTSSSAAIYRLTLNLRKAKISPSFHAASVVSQWERTKTPFCARLLILGPTQNVSN